MHRALYLAPGNIQYCEACRKEHCLPESCIYDYVCDICGAWTTAHVIPREYLPCSAKDIVERTKLKYNRRCH